MSCLRTSALDDGVSTLGFRHSVHHTSFSAVTRPEVGNDVDLVGQVASICRDRLDPVEVTVCFILLVKRRHVRWIERPKVGLVAEDVAWFWAFPKAL